MLFYSSRNQNEIMSPKRAIIKGLASDGGLFCPKIEDITKNKFDVKNLLNNTYNDTAKHIFKLFLDDFSDEELNTCIKNAYNKNNFSSEKITPTTNIGNNFLLELYHGPTSAFKDVGLTMLPQFITCAHNNQSQKEKIYILTATSGDTGKAALSGFKDVQNISIVVFYPANGVSEIQKLQMQTSEGNNVEVIGINDNFDACQKLVKDIYIDNEINEICQNNNVILTSANSMNIGRLLPQVVYYIQSYIDLVNDNKIKLYDKVNFAVPTGNFGDILAGYIAKLLGLPINKLICASNENNVLTDFINNGVYDRNRKFYESIAPSIDILISSNVERLLFWISNNDDKFVTNCMASLKEKGTYSINKELLDIIKKDFVAYFCNDNECKTAINEAFNNDKRLIDTHTAVAYSCVKKYKNDNPTDESKTIILSTASPYKFVKAVLNSIDSSIDTKCINDFEAINKLNEITKEPVPNNLAELQTKKIRFTSSLDQEKAKQHVINNIKEGLK